MATGFPAEVNKGYLITADDMNANLSVLLNVNGTVPMTGDLNCNNLYGIINVGKIKLNSNMYGTSLPNASEGSAGDVFFLLET